MSPHFPPTMTRSSQFFRRAGLAVLIGLGVSAADAQPRGLDARLDRLTDGLTLSTQQSASLDALATEYAEADRADLWAAAAEVSAVLTDAQIDQLQEARTARRSERGARAGEGRQGRRGNRATRGGRQDRTGRGDRQERSPRQGRADRPSLTDEQRDALRAIRSDVRAQAEALAAKAAKCRIFPDEAGKMNRSLLDIGGEALVVSQFTLAADTRSGNRPGFSTAAAPEDGRRLYEHFAAHLGSLGVKVETGQFAADMKVSLTNDGPITIWMEV